MAFCLAENVGATVTGVEYSGSLVTLARHRSEMKSLTDKVTFMEKDMRKLDFEPQSFDAILFWGSLVHVNAEDYLPMFRKAYDWLKPGGRLVMQGLIKSESDGTVTQEFKDYITRMCYKPITYSECLQFLSSSGLQLLEFKHRRDFYVQDSADTLDKVKKNWHKIITNVSKETLEKTVSIWEEKRRWAEDGALYICLLLAQRPLQEE
ncbi:uncharacterized protein LOC134177820 [Corticium candelabrum]|uniref:uncharacterized protein LOC134177820 n=1 Tax=Corticium candelabrum TaxID=121492 RepID=UPI002E2551B8|nr:uncharacterized protein LOC134177820 [Corticium candelabrum]